MIRILKTVDTVPVGCRLEFVTFYMALGAEGRVHPNQTLEHREYLSAIDMMLRSARVFSPGMDATVLTDVHTDLAGMSFPVKHVASHMNPQRLMLERAIAQRNYILASNFSAPIVLLDSDILINGSLMPVFRQAFDVALTWRPDRRMPINGGFLILNNQRPERAKQFFSRFVSMYLERYADKADWFGDQLAFRDCVGLSHEQMVDREIVDIDGCRVLLLPCSTYNFSPKNQYRSICAHLSGKVVLHFKGQRKRLMSPYWKAWVKPGHSSLPWVQFIGWRERRWIARQAEGERAGSSVSVESQVKDAT